MLKKINYQWTFNMGFLENTTTVELTAKLTPYGRQQLLLNTSSMITQFSLGDSDANYYADEKLVNGYVPDFTGGKGVKDTSGADTFNNGLYSGYKIKNQIIVNSGGATKKAIQAGSNSVTITPSTVPSAVSGDTCTHLKVDRTKVSVVDGPNGEANLFQTFGLPITEAQKTLYTTTASPNGYFETAIEDINQDNVLVIEIPNCDYGEVVDGKVVHITVAGYEIYSTFQQSLTTATIMDTRIVETQSLGTPFGANVALLFCDAIEAPTSGGSWADGFGQAKPFSLYNKPQFNAITDTAGTIKDKAIGVVYLSKGMIVITNQEIVNAFTIGVDEPSTRIEFNTISNEVAQNITCIVERDEFATSGNATYSSGDLIRVSEVGLYDASSNLIAVAKANEQVLIGANQFMALGIKILV